jgi:hypothetical protein
MVPSEETMELPNQQDDTLMRGGSLIQMDETTGRDSMVEQIFKFQRVDMHADNSLHEIDTIDNHSILNHQHTANYSIYEDLKILQPKAVITKVKDALADKVTKELEEKLPVSEEF